VGRRYVLEDPNAEGSSEEKRFDAFARGARALIRSYLFENSMAKMDEMESAAESQVCAAILKQKSVPWPLAIAIILIIATSPTVTARLWPTNGWRVPVSSLIEGLAGLQVWPQL
jgi:hypothetical protein